MTDSSDASPLDRLVLVPTREAGLERLRAFLPRAGRWYANHGGIDHGPERRNNTAGLSSWIRLRIITPEEALAAAEAEHGRASIAAFREEIEAPLRRRAWLAARPEVWRAQRLRVEQLFRSMAKSPTLLGAYDEALEGRTGIDAFDAWVRELAEIGWLHPVSLRAFASLWIFSLRLPWELGADLHYRMALDGQAADLLLWREVAGLERGVPPYVVTADEITEISGRRFQPKRRLVEEHARALTEPRAKRRATAAEPAAPEPVPLSGAWGWLITDDDLSAAAPAEAPAAIAALSTAPHRSPFGLGERLSAWLDGALTDALERASAATGVPGERLDDTDWTTSLLGWATGREFTRILARPAPGPARERLGASQRKLETNGLTLATDAVQQA